MAEAAVIDEREETVAEVTAKKRKRVGMWDGNQYLYPADQIEDAKKAVVFDANKTPLENHRAYTITNKGGEVQGYCHGRNSLDALGRFAEAKGYSTELTDPKGGRGRPGKPRIDASTVNLLNVMWASGLKKDAIEFMKENPQYVIHFELTPEEKALIQGGVVEE